MHAVVSTWRLSAGQGFDELVASITDRLGEGGEANLPGHLAGYAIQTARDQMTLVNIYEATDSADAASHALMLVILSVVDGRAELIERRTGPAGDIRAAASHAT